MQERFDNVKEDCEQTQLERLFAAIKSVYLMLLRVKWSVVDF